jgi:NAD(P)-dependent dehydrogenase (short-subunit alcohol dehydrogenase family)
MSVGTADFLQSEKVKEKRVVITGASGGIGAEIAYTFAKHGAGHVDLVARNVDKLNVVAAKVREIAVNNALSIEIHICDLGSVKQLEKLVKDLTSEEKPPIDYLVLNAAVMDGNIAVSSEGIENSVAVNHVHPWYITSQLAKKVRESILYVGAGAYKLATVDKEDPEILNKQLNAWNRYCNAKKLMHIGFFEQVRKLKETAQADEKFESSFNPRLVIVHPGVVSTELGRQWGFLYSIVSLFFLTAQASSEFCFKAAIDGEDNQYYLYASKGQLTPQDPTSYTDASDPELGKWLGEWTEKKIEAALKTQ